MKNSQIFDKNSSASPQMEKGNTYSGINALREQLQIVGALILRDVRAKMMGSALTYVKVIGFPVLHLLTLSAFYGFMGKAALLGTDRVVFTASGVLPFILFLYPIRSNIMVIDENRPLLVFPKINPIDLIISRSVLEIIHSFAIIIILSLILYYAGFNVIPKSPFKTMTGIFMTIIFSFSFCLPNAVLSRLIPNWLQACVLIAVGMYLSSGALFLPTQMPPIVADIMYFNPLAHCVEWVRSGYYETYTEGLLDKQYLFGTTIAFLIIGLCLERFLRGKLS